jgi:uncharacterized membrane protein
MFFCHSFVNIFIMSKKLLIYGLAFGSASAALSYIYLASALYKSPAWIQLISILGEFIVIPAVAIFLFLKSYKQDNSEEFTMGKAVFMSFFLSVIISAAVSLIYSYIHQFSPELIAQLIDYKVNLYANGSAIAKIKATNAAEAQKDIANYAKYNRENVYTMRAQFVSQLFTGGSRGLFLGAIFAYLLRPKTVRQPEDVI